MSMSTRSLLIAATAATLFLAGCATQGTSDNGSGSFTTTNSCGKAPVAAPANTCKGMASCKHKKAKKRHHMKKKMMKAVKKPAAADATPATTTTTTTDTSK